MTGDGYPADEELLQKKVWKIAKKVLTYFAGSAKIASLPQNSGNKQHKDD